MVMAFVALLEYLMEGSTTTKFYHFYKTNSNLMNTFNRYISSRNTIIK